MSVLFLNEDEVRSLLTMESAIEAVESGFRKMALEEAFIIPRNRCQTDHTMLHLLGASAKTLGYLGFKAYTTNRRGARFHITLYDGKTGDMVCLMQGDHLGRYRTGAASGVATKCLARKDATTLSILGSGKQAYTQALAVCAVRAISEIRIYSPTPANREKLADELGKALAIRTIALPTARQAVEGSDVVCTATTAREPVLFGEWLKPGMHLNLAGSNFLSKAEADLETIKRSNPIVIDSRDQGQLEGGDLLPAIQSQLLSWEDLIELSRIVAGRDPGRTSDDQITLFKSLGIAIEDIALGAVVYHNARERGIGKLIDL